VQPFVDQAVWPRCTRGARRAAGRSAVAVTPAHVARVRTLVEKEASATGRTTPRLAVWVPAALAPGTATRRQLAAQIAVYLRPPGYGEMFAALG